MLTRKGTLMWSRSSERFSTQPADAEVTEEATEAQDSEEESSEPSRSAGDRVWGGRNEGRRFELSVADL
eukprot:1064416-Pelagomonas_calceolata.AAC.1